MVVGSPGLEKGPRWCFSDKPLEREPPNPAGIRPNAAHTGPGEVIGPGITGQGQGTGNRTVKQ